jgi:hypothetical protein
MAYVRALIGILLLACSGAWAGTTLWNVANINGVAFASASSACAAATVKNGAVALTPGAGNYCRSATGNAVTIYSGFQCTSTARVSSSSFGPTTYVCAACTATQSNFDGLCEEDPGHCKDKGGTSWQAPGGASGGAWKTGRVGANTFCPDPSSNCVVQGSSTAEGTDGLGYIYGPWKHTGGLCSKANNGAGAGANNEAQTNVNCKVGQCPGTINGVTVCAACASVTSTSAASSAASSVSTNASGVSSSSSSSGSSSSSTTCRGETCTTSTSKTGTNPDGSSSATNETKTQDKPSYCAENPTSPQCDGKDESVFGGSCGAFACDGDAIQCAMAQEQHRRNCQLFDDVTPLSQAGNELANGALRPDGHPANNPDVLGVGAVGLPANPYGSACPADFSLDLIGTSVTVPLSSACDVLRFMGDIAIAFTAVACARIVFGGYKGGV